jgi:hypothetical protein
MNPECRCYCMGLWQCPKGCRGYVRQIPYVEIYYTTVQFQVKYSIQQCLYCHYRQKIDHLGRYRSIPKEIASSPIQSNVCKNNGCDKMSI